MILPGNDLSAASQGYASVENEVRWNRKGTARFMRNPYFVEHEHGAQSCQPLLRTILIRS